MNVISLRDLPTNSRRVNSLGIANFPDSLRLGVVVGGDGTRPTVRWLRLPDGTELHRRDLSTSAGRALPTLAPDLAALAYVSAGGELVLERPFDSPPQARAVAEGPPNSLAFTHTGDRLFGASDHGVHGWATGTFFTAPVTPNEGYGAGFGARILYNSEGGAAGRVSAAAGSGMYAMTHPDGYVNMHYRSDWSGWVNPQAGATPATALAFTNASGDNLIVAHGTVVGVHAMTYEDRDLDFDECYEVFALPPHPATVTGIAVTSDGTRFATACADGVVRLWDMNTGEAHRTFDWALGELTAVAFSPDGHLGAAGTADGRIVLWDMP